MKRCRCSEPKRTKNDAAGIAFYVCAKSKGGCGEEIVDEDLVLSDNFKFIDMKVSHDFTFDDIKGIPYTNEETKFINSPSHMPHNGPCTYGGCSAPGELSRQNTQYNDDDSNWGTYCVEHQKMVDEHWDYMWADYWSSRL